MSLVAEVLPQVVGALQAIDPDERGVALSQLAQVRAYRASYAGVDAAQPSGRLKHPSSGGLAAIPNPYSHCS